MSTTTIAVTFRWLGTRFSLSFFLLFLLGSPQLSEAGQHSKKPKVSARTPTEKGLARVNRKKAPMLKFFSGPINDSCAFRLSIVDEKSRRCEYSLCDQGVVTRTISKAKRQEACEARDDLSFLVDTHLEQTFLGDPKLVGSPAKPDASCLAFQVNGESFFNCNGVAMRWDPEERAYLYMDDGAHNEKLLFVRAFMGLPPPEGH